MSKSNRNMIEKIIMEQGWTDATFTELVLQFANDPNVGIGGSELLIYLNNRARGEQDSDKLSISAGANSDDDFVVVKFDASLWFEQASDDEIWELARTEWSYDYTADRVAQFMADHNGELLRMFAHIELVNKDQNCNKTGFECYIDQGEAMAWLNENRPALAAELRADEDIDTGDS